MADFKINKGDWDAVPADQKKAIVDGLRSTGTLKPDETIVGDSSLPTSASRTGERWDPIGDLCRSACDVAAGAGAAWCTANTAGAGLVACLAAAEVARNACRDRC